MINISKYVALILIFLIANLLPQTSNAKERKSKAEEQENMVINADFLEADNVNKQIRFKGNVVATKGELKISCDELYLYLGQDGKGRGANDLKVEKIVAEGQVVIKRDTGEVIRAEKAVYLGPEEKIEITGSPKMERGADTIVGEKILLDLSKKKVFVYGSDTKKVTATVYSISVSDGPGKVR